MNNKHIVNNMTIISILSLTNVGNLQGPTFALHINQTS